MKATFTTLSLLFVIGIANAQYSEFRGSAGNLIYADTIINQLKKYATETNLKFRSCGLTRNYHSKLQGKARYVTLNKDLKNVAADMDAGISFENFIKKYPDANVTSNLLVIKSEYRDYQNKRVAEINSIGLQGAATPSLNLRKDLSRLNGPLKGKWVYTRETNRLVAFYFTESLSSTPLIEKYARMVQYADCMVDTNTTVFTGTVKKQSSHFVSRPAQTEFENYVTSRTGHPKYDAKDSLFFEKLAKWDSLRFQKSDSLRLKNPSSFNTLFEKAMEEAINEGSDGTVIEEYIARYRDKVLALELKRKRRVIGMCSQDSSPRYHALNIARLAAETVNWEIFLRSHLDIMNDRFDRMSDASYAYGARQTYIRELEVLDINVTDLLFGISFQIEDASKNHYAGAVHRVGRALSEAQDLKKITTDILSMIADNALDDYNRLAMYYLFLNLNYYVEDKSIQEQNAQDLDRVVATLPKYITMNVKKK